MAPLYWAVVLCAIIGVLGLATMYFQVRRAFIKLVEEEEAVGYARQAFTKFPEPVKVVLERLANSQGMMPPDVITLLSDSGLPSPNCGVIEKTGFVVRDPTTGRYFRNEASIHILARLLKEWRAGR
jgi:hypothetical protein